MYTRAGWNWNGDKFSTGRVEIDVISVRAQVSSSESIDIGRRPLTANSSAYQLDENLDDARWISVNQRLSISSSSLSL